MTTWLISRHQAVAQWLELQHIRVDRVCRHLNNPDTLQVDDIVIGNLPLELVARLNKKGVHYFHVTLVMVENQRGCELSLQQMQTCRATLVKYQVTKIDYTPQCGLLKELQGGQITSVDSGDTTAP